MPKFFVTQDKISDNQIIIDSEDVTHISRVLRLEKGDNVTVCDGQGTDYDAQIDTIESKKILLNIVSRQKSETEPNIKVTLFQALPKASKMEYIIQKTTELGISEIVPVKLSRCVVKIDNKKDEKKKAAKYGVLLVRRGLLRQEHVHRRNRTTDRRDRIVEHGKNIRQHHRGQTRWGFRKAHDVVHAILHGGRPIRQDSETVGRNRSRGIGPGRFPTRVLHDRQRRLALPRRPGTRPARDSI